ncbi:hypothetical protein FOMG_19569 [Fusarium oxysporum f. sp. melonis 26406]|uniref:Uncharacterized protein n=1 Tax=Fusarium oxysporum f. sp. melonis 26406 TaxID=1089452 RepID=W9YVS3_FUSOX|nr:hypothetical protein FOMG_19569 [Fusarium oxysporum f. sp. melonis 26406]
MRMPHLEFIYRIVAEMDKGGVTEIKGIDGTAKSRIVPPIQGGYVNGPQIRGVIVEKIGADWAEVIDPNKSLTRLNAMYTLRTDHNVLILVKAQGIYRTGPGVDEEFEATRDSSYGWLNSVVAVGVMIMWQGKPVIDCYRLTNFPGKRAANL